MSLTIINSKPEERRRAFGSETETLQIAEFFSDTIQGEGIYTGHPATFLRMQKCTLNCSFCDTRAVWRYGNPYTIAEIFELMEIFAVIEKLKDGQHLVLTGGSPLFQQNTLYFFIFYFIQKYGFKPFIEIENECTIMPTDLIEYVDCWNNSPKLQSSGNDTIKRYRPKVIQKLSSLDNSWFKFVVSCQSDWDEIELSFLETGLIKKSQIILMPLGGSKKELQENRSFVVDLAIRENVRYSTREHVVLWDELTGV